MVNSLESEIDDATKAGKLTSDQASALTKELDDIKNTLGQTASNGTAQTNNATQLSADDRNKIRKDLQDIGKQLFQAFNTQAASSTQQGSNVDQIFKAMDANNDGSISKDEMTNFLSSLTSNATNANGLISSNYTYSEQATLSVSETQSRFSITA